jgi:hypothetical protein
MMDVINLTGELPHAIETRKKIPACLALQWDETKGRNAFGKALRKETRRSTTALMAFPWRSKLALIPRSVSVIVST